MSTVPDITAVVAHMMVPALAVDADGRIDAANGVLARCLKRDAAELIGTALGSWTIDAVSLPDFLRAGSGCTREFRFRAGDGGERALALSIAMPSPARVDLLTARDVTEHRAAEREMLQEVARYRDMTRAASDWFFELDNTMTRMRLVRPRDDERRRDPRQAAAQMARRGGRRHLRSGCAAALGTHDPS